MSTGPNRTALFGGAVVLAAVVAGAIGYFVATATSGQKTAAAAPAAASLPAAPAAPAAADADDSGPPAPKIIVIDRNMILRLSSAGKDMLNQAQGLSKKADAEFKARADALQKEAAGLQQQLAILAPDVRAKKEKAFQDKQQALQREATERNTEIQNGFAKAGQKLDQALGPILQQIMKERGANLLVDRSAVILASIDVDVTAQAIQRLDKVLPHVKVELSKTAPTPAPNAPAVATAKPPAVRK